MLASSVERDVYGDPFCRIWLCQWFQTLNLSFTFTFVNCDEGDFIISPDFTVMMTYWSCPCDLWPCRSRIIEGTEVIQETYGKSRGAGNDDIPRRGPDSPPVGHHDIITDISMCQTAQCFIVTSARDGVVKVWKWYDISTCANDIHPKAVWWRCESDMISSEYQWLTPKDSMVKVWKWNYHLGWSYP